MTNKELYNALMDCIVDHPMTGNKLAKSIGLAANTLHKFLRSEGNGRLPLEVKAKIMRFLRDADIEQESPDLSVVERCTLQNAVRACGDDISDTIIALTNHVGVQEFDEIKRVHLKDALVFLHSKSV